MSTVLFEEETMSKHSNNIRKERSIVGFLTRHGIIKNRKIALIVVVIVCLAVIGSSICWIYKINKNNQIVPYEKLSASVKSKLPLSVQLLYTNKQ